eukprot:1713484-Prymnesium_polylepis.1
MVGGDPREQGREACGDDAEELTTMQRVKRVANVESGIDPAPPPPPPPARRRRYYTRPEDAGDTVDRTLFSSCSDSTYLSSRVCGMLQRDPDCVILPSRGFAEQPAGSMFELSMYMYSPRGSIDPAGYHGTFQTTKFPAVPGHELAGVCVAVGPNVTKVKVGDRGGLGEGEALPY